MKKELNLKNGFQCVPPSPHSPPEPYLEKPRVSCLEERNWTDIHRTLVAKYAVNGITGNDFKTLLHIPELVKGAMPLFNYIRHHSSLDARHRDILILRVGWLSGCEYIWNQQIKLALANGMTRDSVRQIAKGPSKLNPDSIEEILFCMVDQMFINSSVNEAVWSGLEKKYDIYHMLDAVVTVACSTTMAMVYNSIGIQTSGASTCGMPTDIPYRISVAKKEPALRCPRVEPCEGVDAIAIKRLWARYPELARRHVGSKYVMYKTELDPRYRELLILRMGWNCQAQYEWAQHMGRVGRGRELGLDPLKIAIGPADPGWPSIEKIFLTTADELYQNARVSGRTWTALSVSFNEPEIMEILFIASNYRMVSMVCNTIGIQIDEGEVERLPIVVQRRGSKVLRDVSIR